MKHIANCFRVKQAQILIIKSKNEKNLQKSHAAHSLQNNNSTAVLTKKTQDIYILNTIKEISELKSVYINLSISERVIVV
jgi:adenosine/AMP kinase